MMPATSYLSDENVGQGAINLPPFKSNDKTHSLAVKDRPSINRQGLSTLILSKRPLANHPMFALTPNRSFGIYLMLTYKYCPSSRVSFFQDRKLRFSQPTSLNDPHECLPTIDDFSPGEYVETVINRQMATLLARIAAELPEASIEEIAIRINFAKASIVSDLMKDKERFACIAQDRIRKRIDATIGILSLAKKWDIELLWSHYAEAYQGFVVGLESNSIFFQKRENEQSDIGFLEDVNYVDCLPRVQVGKLELPRDLFYTKQSAWAYECEQRLVRRLDHGAPTGSKDNFSMPVVLFDVPMEAVREITIGFRASATTVSKAVELRASNEGRHIELFKSRFSSTSGNLERAPL